MYKDFYSILNLIPTFAIAVFTWRQYSISKQKKKNDLFQIRYKFYKELEKAWLSNYPTVDGDNDLQVYEVFEDDLKPLALEAKFLFGNDIYEHIMSLAHNFHKGHQDYPEEWFIKPFEKYLILK